MTEEQRKTGGPIGGTPESAAWFRAMLEQLGENQSSMARLMHRKGDDRQPITILRTIQRMAAGEARVSGEMRVILTMMLRAKDRAAKRTDDIKRSASGGERRTAEKAADRDHPPTEQPVT